MFDQNQNYQKNILRKVHINLHKILQVYFLYQHAYKINQNFLFLLILIFNRLYEG